MRATLAIPLALALLLIAAAAAPPAGAREQSPKCYPKGAQGIAAGTRARVFYVVNADDEYRYYTCDLLTGRRTVIDEGFADRSADSMGQFAVAGRTVAWVRGACPYTMPTLCSHRVHRLDVQTRRGVSGPAEGPVWELVLHRSGAVAWIETPYESSSGQAVRRLLPGGGTGTLDPGPGVRHDSLALAEDATVYWRNGGQPRSAQLEGAEAGRYSDPEPRGHRKCFPSRSETIAASLRIRVFSRLVDGDRITYGLCDLRTGSKTRIATVSDTEEPFSVRPVRLAGTFAAIGTRLCGKYACQQYKVRVYDVTGASTALELAAGGWVFDIALRPDGAFAWMQGAEPSGYSAPGDRELRRCVGWMCDTLDKAGDLGTESLALSVSSDLYWTRGGEPRTAPLEGRR